MKSTLKIGSLLLLAATLVACGGSDSSTSPTNTSPIDKYIGVWKNKNCEIWEDNAFAYVSLEFSKLSSQSMKADLNVVVYSNPQCTGNSTIEKGASTYEFQGTKAVQTFIADKFLATSADQSTSKVLLHATDQALYLEDPSSGTDADGYAKMLFLFPLTR